ncbi:MULTISPECIES: chemotaxis protein [unclassified Streptomyces]|uniref:baeRF3 domain-containing protein n=1 Tax=unclassified Streptomyces TaxID=2593676 RepID=UPI001F04FB92|nr:MULTISPECIES: chemotaxis protein [unclassified Streptomyces]MCH0565755.1 chemotaxis protein [Streptomyces sp. MUM 2J]MCH0571010.1 chemotaxis protein [Streptomyces sp. MUM 136J]
MEHALSPATLAELRRPRPYPAVSVLTPTHRRAPLNSQDRVRLRNAVAQAKRQLESDPAVTRERRADVVQELDRALAEVDLAHAEDGLVIFAAPGEHQVWSLTRSVPERVVLSDTFLTRNLVSAQVSERPFWALSVSPDRVTLWSGGVDRVTEEHVGGFPLTRSRQNFDAERQERIGDQPSIFRDENTRQFLREADAAMNGILRDDPRPVYVTGEQAALSLLDEVGSVAGYAVQLPHGGLAHGTPEAVWQAVHPVHEAEQRRQAAEVAGELTSARGHRTFAAGVDEVWQNAREGRIRLLAVEENFSMIVRGVGDHLEPATSGDPDAREDIVDEIVEQCLETGAQVRFVPDGTLGDATGIAGVLRY